jgi:hypothetical protein
MGIKHSSFCHNLSKKMSDFSESLFAVEPIGWQIQVEVAQ